ncbi:MAG: inositol monophosphatase [Epsilonproteobacteria bacterium]|nr:inositol monophosphatase [Campylobacterota bacterium]
MVEKFKSIVEEAGKILQKGYYSKKEVSFKGKKDLITKYDILIEEFLRERFKGLGYTIIGEETLKEEFNNSIIIDPIDGTTNFANGLPFCAISVGVYENKEAKYGFVYNPILEEMFWAQRGKGAFLNGKRLRVSNESIFQRALIATGFPYSGANNKDDLEWVVDRLKKILPNCQDIRRYGSASLDLCYVAKGSYEGFYEINLKPWDVSAGILIVQEAGGKITNERGEEYDMFKDRCIVATNQKIHNRLISYLA